MGRLLQAYHRSVRSTQASIKLTLSNTSTRTQLNTAQAHEPHLVHIKGSQPCQSDRELKGQWVQNGTRHAQSLISPVWEKMAFKKGGQVELKCQNGIHSP